MDFFIGFFRFHTCWKGGAYLFVGHDSISFIHYSGENYSREDQYRETIGVLYYR
jgi:hypothetical protein